MKKSKKRNSVNYKKLLRYLLKGNTLTPQQAVGKFKLRHQRYFYFLIYFARILGYKIYKIKVRKYGKRRKAKTAYRIVK